MDFDDCCPSFDPTALPRIVGRAQAFTLGFSRRAVDHRLAVGPWRRILPRTYLTVDTLTWPDRQAAALTFAGPDALLSGRAALTDLGLRSVSPPRTVLVLVPHEPSVRSYGWVQIRRTHRMPEAALLPGPRRAPVARAVADTALATPKLDDVRALVTEAVRLRLCTLDELLEQLREGPRRGSAFLRQAVEEVTDGAWSAPEARAATLMRRAGLPAFEQNARVVLPDGRFFTVDFLWRRLRAILEIDSDTHHGLTGDADWTADRHALLETAGYSVVHRTPRFVHREPDRFIAGMTSWLDSRRP